MARARAARIITLLLVVVAIGAGGYWLLRPQPAPPIVGVVLTTEVRIAPEVAGQLATIKVHKGDTVRAGDVVAELSAIELTASVDQARAALGAATADRNNIYAGVRAEQIASQQALDQAQSDAASARADVAEAQANHDAAVAGPTREERAITDAQVKAAATALAVLERRLDKTILRAPADSIVSVIVAEVGENIHAGQPVLVIEAAGKQWLSFNAREDFLRGLTVGSKVNVGRASTHEAVESAPHLCQFVRNCVLASSRLAARPLALLFQMISPDWSKVCAVPHSGYLMRSRQSGRTP
jgi:HlyD family secretion protein